MTSDAVYKLLEKEIIYLRTALERAAIPLIMQRVRPEDIRDLRKLAGEFEAACRRGVMAAMILINLACHWPGAG